MHAQHSPTRFLVTGGAGFIGSHLVRRLIRKSLACDQRPDCSKPLITVLDNLSRGRRQNLEDCSRYIDFVEGDVRSRDLLEALMDGVDVVYHLAAQSNVLGAATDPDYCFSTNVEGTYEVLRAAQNAGTGRVIFASSREAYGEPEAIPVPETAPLHPKNMYGASKVAGEVYCRAFAEQGLAVCVVRLANVYGTRDTGRVIPLFIANALSGRPLTVYGKNKLLDFVWIGNVLDVLVQAGSGPFHAGPINVGSGVGVQLMELAERIRDAARNECSIEIVDYRSAEVDRFVADVSVARSLYGLERVTDPLNHLPEVVADLRTTLPKRSAAAVT